jgi:hypothetical protein
VYLDDLEQAGTVAANFIDTEADVDDWCSGGETNNARLEKSLLVQSSR